MAKRRKVSNLLALAVLAAVSQKPMHPYEMASALRAWGKDKDLGIKWGSLYTVVRNMHKHGFLEAVESNRQGGRPERTVYRVTEAGRAELVDWTGELLGSPERERSSFTAGLSMVSVLAPDEVITLLRHRLGLLDREIEEQRAALEKYRREVPRLFLVEDEYELAVLAAEADWVRSLLGELTSGTFPDLATWRSVHRTGRPPADWIALAEGGRSEQPGT